MSTPAVLLAWLLAVGPLALELFTGGDLAIQGASRLGLTLLPFAALAGLPRPRASPEGAVWGAALFALPPASLGAALDLERGAGGGAVLLLLAVGLLLVGGLGWAASRGGTAHGVLWLLAVAAPPALGVARGLSVRGGGAGSGAGMVDLVGASPLGWIWAWTRAGALEAPSTPSPLPPLAVCLVLGLVALRFPRPREPR